MRMIDYSNMNSSNTNNITKTSDESNTTQPNTIIQKVPLVAGSRRVLNSITDSKGRISEPVFSKSQLQSITLKNSKAHLSLSRNLMVNSKTSLRPGKSRSVLHSMSSINQYIESNSVTNPGGRFFPNVAKVEEEDTVEVNERSKKEGAEEMKKEDEMEIQKVEAGKVDRSKKDDVKMVDDTSAARKARENKKPGVKKNDLKKVKDRKRKIGNNAKKKKSIPRKLKKGGRKLPVNGKGKKAAGGKKKKKVKESLEEHLIYDPVKNTTSEELTNRSDDIKKTRLELASNLKEKLGSIRLSVSKEGEEQASLTSIRKSGLSQNFGNLSDTLEKNNLTSQAQLVEVIASEKSLKGRETFSKKDLEYLQVSNILQFWRGDIKFFL